MVEGQFTRQSVKITLTVVEANFDQSRDKIKWKIDTYPALEFTEEGNEANSRVLRGPIHRGKQMKPKWSWTCDFYIDDDSTGHNEDTVKIMIYEKGHMLVGASDSFTL